MGLVLGLLVLVAFYDLFKYSKSGAKMCKEFSIFSGSWRFWRRSKSGRGRISVDQKTFSAKISSI
ncbi:unnamed protein product [Oikopleura dioica]|uniref:Uncharacterized protein n=1 Tax=Oikopleura dioica TaxID=34765 RepID=E4Z165_OIKDI|nr:unnamed protein product [Oikopleura dioica]